MPVLPQLFNSMVGFVACYRNLISRCLGFAALYPFLDFKSDPSTAGVIVLIAAIQIPVIHIGLVTFADYIQTGEEKKESSKKD